MPHILIEACCGSADDALEAARGGADRVELNAALFLGGLTPSAGSLRVLRRASGIPVMAMLRPREGGFCYTDAEFATMLADGELLLSCGADGLVFGCLTPEGGPPCSTGPSTSCRTGGARSIRSSAAASRAC